MRISSTDQEKIITLQKTIIDAMVNKKAEEIVSIDLRRLNNPVSEMFIICHASNGKQVEAIAENIEKEVFQNLKEKPMHREGYDNKEWILLDYFNILVHVFLEEKRYFFALEQLWGDGNILNHQSN